jgi:hypothetical protein
MLVGGDWSPKGHGRTKSVLIPDLQWIVLSGLPLARGATTVEQIRFALHPTEARTPSKRNPATAINLVYLTMRGTKLQIRARKATLLILIDEPVACKLRKKKRFCGN